MSTLPASSFRPFIWVTGATDDTIRHSAIYFRDDSAGQNVDVVFSHGGIADGVNTFSGYLSNYKASVDPTTAYRLKLSHAEVRDLFEGFKADWELRRVLVYVGDAFNGVSNNCAQYVCRKIIAEGSNWDSARGILSEAINVDDKVDPLAPVVFTNGAIYLLRELGYLGDAEKDLQPQPSASTDVTVYWSYHPQ